MLTPHLVPMRQRMRHERWLRELTAIPTAAGLEHRVITWVVRWVARRPHLTITSDRVGNLIIRRRHATRRRRGQHPLYITAHLDHPAFVVRRVIGTLDVELEFRGGVKPSYFRNASIQIIDARNRVHRAEVIAYDPAGKPFPLATARLEKEGSVLCEGDLGRWALDAAGPLPRVVDGHLHARACDDLAGVSAALAAFDILSHDPSCDHARVLLTRAEEVGFIGAIAHCSSSVIPAGSALICLETSRCSADAPVGGGPIVRVGDRTSVFSAPLTNRISAIAARHAELQPGFLWQRKLMTGGTCEATAFAAFGYDATCLCLPLDNYHNMIDIDGGEDTDGQANVGPEIISVEDFHGLVELLIVTAGQLHFEREPFRARMDALYAAHHHLL